MTIPSEPEALHKYMRRKGAFEVDQFPYKDWVPETNQMKRDWERYREIVLTEDKPEQTFNIRINLIDKVQPFVNKRGVRDRNFRGEEHELRLLQLENIPGYAKLVYRNHIKQVGTMLPVFIYSRESIESDVSKVAKKLYKKAKKLQY